MVSTIRLAVRKGQKIVFAQKKFLRAVCVKIRDASQRLLVPALCRKRLRKASHQQHRPSVDDYQ